VQRPRHLGDPPPERGRDTAGLLAVLDPDVVRKADPAALPPGAPAGIHGARSVTEETVPLAVRAAHAEPALADGGVGLVVAPRLRLARLGLAVPDLPRAG
jgi:RNA polymerase sigma-70 factor (ECF subfamily)